MAGDQIRATTLTVLAVCLAAAAMFAAGLSSDGSESRPKSIQVHPPQATIQVGQTVQLAAVLLDDDGKEIPGETFRWWSPAQSVATVDSTGTVAGVGAGQVTVSAFTTDRSVSGFADVTVRSAGAAAPDIPAPDVEAESPIPTRGEEADPATTAGIEPARRLQAVGAGPNAPPDFSFIVDRPFSTYDENGWVDRRHGGAQHVADGTARITYRTGFVGGSAPGASWFLMPGSGNGYETVYLSFTYLLSSDWQGHPSEMNKIWFFAGGQRTFATVKALGGPGATGFKIQVTAKQTAKPLRGQKYRNINPNRGGPMLRRGQPAAVEMVVKINSAPEAFDGELHVWVDGVRTHEYAPARGNGIRWWDGGPRQASRIDELKWAPVWGGTGSTVSATMYAEMSNLYVSGR